jgi:hypothetical protein
MRSKLICLIATIALLNSCAGHGMVQYVVVNPATKDAVVKHPVYKYPYVDHIDEPVYAIALDSVGDLCRKDKKNKVHIYIGEEKHKADCEILESEILKNYDSIDSIKIFNGERYSGYEVFSILMTGAVLMGFIGYDNIKNSVAHALGRKESYEPDPLSMYIFAGLFGIAMATILYYDLNGSILYMSKDAPTPPADP